MKIKIVLAFACGLVFTACEKKIETSEPEAGGSSKNKATVSATAVINASSVQQLIRGFGGANIRGWIPDLTAAQRTKAFSPSSGMGLSILRVRVPNSSSEFAAEKPTIDAAKSYGASVIASAWSAPASMKDNNNVVGGKLKTTSYADYATHLRDFNTAMGGLLAISPSNEPNIQVNYESMEMTAAEVANFVAA